MGDKDITERSLEWFNDVFSDIVNAWFAVNGVGDMKFRDAIKKAQDMEKKGEPLNMRSFLTEAMNDGIAIGEKRGITIGRNEGISIGEQRARRSIMDRLIATGMSPSQAASLTGVNV